MKDCAEEKPDPAPDTVHSARHSGFKKKKGRSNIPSSEFYFCMGYTLQISRERQNLYEKTFDWVDYLQAHNSTMGAMGSYASDTKCMLKQRYP